MADKSLELLLRSIISGGKLQYQETKGPDLLDSNNNELIKGNATASAVNQLDLTNAATGNPVLVSTSGGDTNIGMQVGAKGTGAIAFTVPMFYETTPDTIATAGNATFTTAQVLGGIILRDPAGGARTDTTPTAAALVAAAPGVAIGSTFSLLIRNTADAAETITIAGGTGVTVSGTATIAQSNSKLFLVRFNAVAAGSEAVTIYSVGTFVH